MGASLSIEKMVEYVKNKRISKSERLTLLGALGTEHVYSRKPDQLIKYESHDVENAIDFLTITGFSGHDVVIEELKNRIY